MLQDHNIKLSDLYRSADSEAKMNRQLLEKAYGIMKEMPKNKENQQKMNEFEVFKKELERENRQDTNDAKNAFQIKLIDDFNYRRFSGMKR